MQADGEALLPAKQQMIIAARAAGVMPLGFIDSVADFSDWDRFRAMVRKSRRLGFDGADWRTVEGAARWQFPPREALVRFAVKVGFWTLLLLSLPLMLTVILGLFPLFGTDGEALLIRLHGYSALLLMTTALLELYMIIACIGHSTEQPLKGQNP